MGKNLKYYHDRPVTIEKWHMLRIRADYKRFKSSLHLYLAYKLQFVPRYYKKIVDYIGKRRNDRMNDNLKYWRENGALVVADADTMEPMKSMADGNMYTSKSTYYKETAARGFEIVGNDKQEKTPLENYYANLAQEQDIKQDIKEAINGRRTH